MEDEDVLPGSKQAATSKPQGRRGMAGAK